MSTDHNPSKPRSWWVQEWQTAAVTALPAGWRNVWRCEDGKTITQPCPALLVQELRETVKYWDVAAPEGSGRLFDVQSRTERLTPPYETRVVFADYEVGSLGEAGEDANYLGAVGSGEDADEIYGIQTSAGTA